MLSCSLQQQLAQEQLNIPYEQYVQQQAYPFQTASFLGGLTEGIGSLEGGTATTRSPGPGLASTLGGLGVAGLGAAGLGSSTNWFGLGGKRGGSVEAIARPKLAGGGSGGAPGLDYIPQSIPSIPDVSVSYIPSIAGGGGRGASIPGGGPGPGGGGSGPPAPPPPGRRGAAK